MSSGNIMHDNADLRLNIEENGAELEIDLVELLYRLIEKAKWIIAAVLLGILAMGLFTKFMITPTYQATAKLIVQESKNNVVDLSAINLSDKLAADYVQVFHNWHVHEKVIQTLDLPYTYEQIQNMLKISVLTNTRIIAITVTSHDPQEAKDIAMTYAQVAPAFIEAKMETSRPNIFEEPRVPTEPSAPRLLINLLLGAFIGGVISVGVILIQFISDDRVRNAEILQKRLGLPTLGMMPIQGMDEKKAKRKPGKGAKK